MLKQAQRQKRQQQVLCSLVKHYISTGEPVSSRDVAADERFDLSPATIRAALAQLDEMNWTTQPHASAGRVPTLTGYRTYISLLHERDLSRKDFRKKLDKHVGKLDQLQRDIGSVLQQTASFIADNAEGVGVVVPPQFSHDFIRSIKLVLIDERRLLAVMLSEIGLIKTETIAIDTRLTYFMIKRIEEYINARLGGKEQLEQFGTDYFSENELMLAEKYSQELFLKYMIGNAPTSNNELVVEGFSNLLGTPDFREKEYACQAIKFFEQKDQLLQICDSDRHKELTVVIGDEIATDEAAQRLCVVRAPYSMNGLALGMIAAVCPLRSDYCQTIPLIRQVADWLTERFSKKLSTRKIGYNHDIPYKIIIG